MKKFKTSKTGLVTTADADGKFKTVGRMTLGFDDKGREKAIVNIDDVVYSCFLNVRADREVMEKLRKHPNEFKALAQSLD